VILGGAVVWALFAARPILAQPSVPFVGCVSYGQVKRVEAPLHASRSVQIGARGAALLAYYESGDGIGVLAPRGWHCLGASGSSGSVLWVSPRLIDPREIGIFEGPAVELQRVSDENSGSYQIAEVMARVFPAYRAYAEKVWALPDVPFPSGRSPGDRLTYKGKTVVEYKTAGKEGMGTRFGRLSKDGGVVTGVVSLIGGGHEMLLLSMRLPAELMMLERVIVGDVEREARK